MVRAPGAAQACGLLMGARRSRLRVAEECGPPLRVRSRSGGMNPLHKRLFVRLSGAVLLLLMLSPVTAPFATCDLADLLAGTSSDGGAVLQSKPLQDGAALIQMRTVSPEERGVVRATIVRGDTGSVTPSAVLRIPLRI